ncbi:MAG: HAD family phosphatase [Eubacteriales bacterium]|nr:HAD family phosphatase [Eubacteriales bacterium]
MIRNIIFDIGNVLVDFCWREHLERFGFFGEEQEKLAKALMLGPIWPQIDLGIRDDQELLEAFVKSAPELESQIRLVYSDLSTIVREREGSAPWLRSLKERGYRIYYLSNYGERIRRETEQELSFLPEMDGGIMSYTVHLIKPDPAIYRALLEKYGLKAEECVFLDDSRPNVEAARALGMEGVEVESQEQAKQELEKLLERTD